LAALSKSTGPVAPFTPGRTTRSFRVEFSRRPLLRLAPQNQISNICSLGPGAEPGAKPAFLLAEGDLLIGDALTGQQMEAVLDCEEPGGGEHVKVGVEDEVAAEGLDGGHCGDFPSGGTPPGAA